MVLTPTTYDDVAAFLYRDPFPNASMIGAIERRLPDLSDVWIAAESGRGVEGVLVRAPGVAGERAIGIDAVTPAAAAELLDALPAGEEMSFGLHRPLVVETLRHRLRVHTGAIMLCFRCDTPSFQADERGLGRELSG